MKKVFLLLAIGISALLLCLSFLKKTEKKHEIPHVRSTFSPKGSKKDKTGREDYFFNILRDPATNSIPQGIRAKELSFAKKLDQQNTSRKVSVGFDWKEAGPNDVGGRTRAIGIDIRNSNIIIAGGVSGGIYRSEDKGESWTLVNNPDEYNGITSIAQDTRENHQDTWYYSTGEFEGNSASAGGWSAIYYGNGLYKSIDNGVSWNLISGTNGNQSKWDKYYDYVSKLKVNPKTGSLFVCSNGFGIVKLSEGGASSSAQLVLGEENGYYWSDVDIHNNGTILAFLSKNNHSSGTQTKEPGVYISKDDGNTFTFVTKPSSFPTNYDRGLVRIAPSNKDVAYLYVVDNTTPYFYKINLASKTMEDRSANVRQEFEGNTFDAKLGAQGDYNMTLAVHPTDENFIIVGSTCLFRSKDGFSSKPNEYYTWIGGYGNKATKNSTHPNHHPDCHITIFDPNNSDQVWSGHDGGLSLCMNIKEETNYNTYLKWLDKNKGYNITQFYNVAINHTAEGYEFLGGSQDNGSPYFTYQNGSISKSNDAFSGDGSYCAITKNNTFASCQFGTILRREKDIQQWNTYNDKWATVNPLGLKKEDKLFIHPYILDQNNNNVMFYPFKNNLWVNSDLSKIPNYQNNGSYINWSYFNVASSGYTITTLSGSVEPKNILYIGAYNNNSKPEFYRIENPTLKEKTITKVNIPNLETGSYPHDIAINPEDANEFIVVLSNYNIKGLYHSTDGGKNYTCIEGNLEGTSYSPGPSLRCAGINTKSSEKRYFVGTSTGLYSTDHLDGDKTIWTKVEKNLIGSVVVQDIDINHVNGNMAIGTHGRGIFAAKNQNPFIYVENPIEDIIIEGSTSEIVRKIDISNVFKGDGQLEFSIAENTNTELLNAEIIEKELILKILPKADGKTNIKIKCFYGDIYCYNSFTVKVNSPYVKVINQLETTTLFVNEKSFLDIDFTNIFENATKFELVSNTNEELISTSLDNSKLRMTITPDLTGESSLVVKASNEYNSIEIEFKIIINYPTVTIKKQIDSYNLIVNEQSSFEINLSEFFENANKYELVSNSNENLISISFDNSKLKINITPDLTGESSIVIKASNEHNYANIEFKIIVSKSTAIENSLSDKFTVYPNPTNGLSYVKIGDSELIGNSITVVNSTGQTIITKRITDLETTINLTNKPKGIYFITIQNKNSIGTKKVIKK